MTDEKKTETAKEAATVKKAMISQPMAGKTDEGIVATRDLAVAKLRQMGYEVVSNTTPPPHTGWRCFMRSSEFSAEAARMTVDAVKALAECLARAFLQAAKAIRKLAKRLDPRWQRRYRRALARSRRNNLYLKSIGRCR